MLDARCKPVVRILVACLITLTAGLAGCRGGSSEPTPMPFPTPLPTATPSVEQAVDGVLYTIHWGDTLLATERLRVGEVEGQLLISSEMQRYLGHPDVERRSVLLSQGLTPTSYDLERSQQGARSTWVLEREGESVNCLSNNTAWLAPVYIRGVNPAPDALIESAPSALSYVLLTLAYAADVQAAGAEGFPLNTLDSTEDYPVSRVMTLTLNSERTGAVIGTEAVEGRIAGSPNPAFTLWQRPGSRLLYSVEVPDFQLGFWDRQAYPAMQGRKMLVIQRVSKWPEPPTQPAYEGEVLEFAGSGAQTLAGGLILPPGNGPFPCLVVLGSGSEPRLRVGSTLADSGWAAFCYDPPGLGESEGQDAAGMVATLADTLIAAAEALGQRPEIDGRRIVVMGLGDGGLAAALAVSRSNLFSGAILAACGTQGALFPGLAEWRIANALAPFYGWDAVTTADYRQASVTTWQRWLFDGETEVALARRRLPLAALRQQADEDLFATLDATDKPLLILHGDQDRWTPYPGAQALAQRLKAAGHARVSFVLLTGEDERLGGRDVFLSEPSQQAVTDWLGTLNLP